MERDPAPLRWLVLLVPFGLFAVAAGVYDLVAGSGHVGRLTAVLIVVHGVLLVWCGLAFARGRQHWWHYAVAIAAETAAKPLDDRVVGEPLRLRPSMFPVIMVAVTVYAVVRAVRRRSQAEAAQPSRLAR